MNATGPWRPRWSLGVGGVALGLALVPPLAVTWLALFWCKLFAPHFDMVGHGVEIIVAEKEKRAGYRAAEIERMRLYSSEFRGWSTERIDAGLRKREWLSRIFAAFYA